MYESSFYTLLQMRRPRVGYELRYAVAPMRWHTFTDVLPQNPRSINKVVTLLIPGLTPELLHLPPLPTSATANPNLPLQVPLPQPDAAGSPGVPFIQSTFTYACPTRAPGDQFRMHSVLNAFFQGPVTGEEKKRRLTDRLLCECSPVRALGKV